MTYEEIKALMEPSAEDRKRLAGEALMQFGLGVLANNTNRRNPFPALGAGGMMGMQSYRQGMDQLRSDKLQDFKMRQLADELSQKQAQQEFLSRFAKTLPEDQQMAFQLDPKGFLEAQRKASEGYTLSPGQVRFEGKNQVANVPAEPKKLPEWQDIDPITGAPRINPLYLSMKKEIAQASRPVVETKVFNNTKDDFKNERDLRNDFSGLPTTKAFNEVQSAYDQINVALKQASPAGDLAAATKIMKILDPGSVVRESELGMAMAATGMLDRVQNYAQLLISGQKLTPAQRQDFGDLASKLYEAAAGRYNASADEYQSIARDYNLNPARVAKPAKNSTFSAGGWSATKVRS